MPQPDSALHRPAATLADHRGQPVAWWWYISARFDRRVEMLGIRAELQAIGHWVTSGWLDLHSGTAPETYTNEEMRANPLRFEQFARSDIDDLSRATAVLAFSSGDGSGSGGRHIEVGYALACSLPVFLIGPRENVFHTLTSIHHYPDWPTFRGHLRAEMAQATVQPESPTDQSAEWRR